MIYFCSFTLLLSNLYNSLFSYNSLLSLSSHSRHNEGNTSQGVGDCSSRKLKLGKSSSCVGKTSIRKTGIRKTGIRKTGIRKTGIRKTSKMMASKWKTSISQGWGSNLNSRGFFLSSSRSSCYKSRGSKSIAIWISSNT